MHISPWRPIAVFSACASALALAGCGVQGVSGLALGSGSGGYIPPAGDFAGLGFTGRVMAGVRPLHGAAVQLYTAGTGGNGSAPTQLLSATLSTDANGDFHVAPGSYTCPTGNSVLYVTASGGSAGEGAFNNAAKMITVPGACSSLADGSIFVVNELTTVATAYALRAFLSAGGQLGSTATNAQGLGLAVATMERLVDLTSGIAPGSGFAANGTAPVAKMNTLANLLHGCVTGGALADGCETLFAQTATGLGQPTDTLQVAISVANHPGTSLSAGLGSATFTPALASAPADWTLAIPFTGGGMQGPSTVSIDQAGQVWVANYFGVASLFTNAGAPVFPDGLKGNGLQESYGGAVDALGRMWVANEQNDDSTVNHGAGSISVLDDSGPALPGNSMLAAGGLNFPVAIAFDRSGTAWVVNYGNSHVTLLNASGVPQSGTEGYVSSQFVFPVAVAVDSQGLGWVANQSATTVTRVAVDGSSFTSFPVGDSPSAVAIDAADNVWTANFYGDSAGLISAKARVLSGTGYTGGGLNHPAGVAVDGAGTAWLANYRAPGISALAGASTPQPGAALSGASGWASDVGMLEAFGIAVDAAGDVWITSYGDNRLVEVVGAAVPVQTPLLGGVRVP